MSQEITQIDHVALGLSRLTQQYADKPNIVALVTALMNISNELEQALITMLSIVSIDDSEGVQLDVIGIIVGLSRVVPNAITLSYWGFTDTPGAGGFGELSSPGFGARFYDIGEPLTATNVLSDPEYRLLLKAQIVKNNGKGRPEDVLAGLVYLFSEPGTTVSISLDDNGGMGFGLGIGRRLTVIEQSILKNIDILSRPDGVKLTSVVYYDTDNVFGFADTPGAKGWGELNNSSYGGAFAEAVALT